MPLQPEDMVPMAPKLKTRVLELARKYREDRAALKREAQAIVLCPPTCGEVHPRFADMHCHTYWDMLCAWEELDYGWKCRQAADAKDDQERLDTRPHLARAGVRDTHRAALANLDDSKVAMRMMRAWLAQSRDAGTGAMAHPWLVLAGSTGAGKTQAAVVAMEHFVRRYPWNSQAGGGGGRAGRPFVLIHATDFVQLARQARAYSRMGNANALVEEACLARVLVLDDVGTEKLEPDGVELFHRLVNERHAARRVTVWTSNATPKDLETRLDFAGQEAAQMGRLWRRVSDLAAVCEVARTGSRMRMGGRTVEFPSLGKGGAR